MDVPDIVRQCAARVRAAGGRALLIGGAVRDRLLRLTPTDFDLEVYGLSPDAVRAVAWELGRPREVGRAFGVLEIRLMGPIRPLGPIGPITLHLSLPRRESKVAPGHRGFAVNTDPGMDPTEAARRRDFTINAIAEDPLTGEILDPFSGRRDLARHILRVVDERTFGDDPLRVLRAAVFAAQFGLAVDPASDAVIRRAVPLLRELPRERVSDEWRKLLSRPRAPSRGLRLLMDWGVFAVLHPEFATLPATPQNPRWHPEGDVWTHTMLAVDEAARIVHQGAGSGGLGVGMREPNTQHPTPDTPWWVLLTTLCHDLGKAAATREIRGVWRSPGHDAAGVEPTRRFLHALAADRRTMGVVLRLVREHLQPLHTFRAAEKGAPVADGTIRALARRLHPATIFLLTLVADADHRGRGPFPQGGPPAADAGERLRRRAEALGVLHGPPQPVLRGADLIALGFQPGPHFGKLLREAEELRDAAGLSREEILERLRREPPQSGSRPL